MVEDGEECGLLVPRRDVKALAKAMQYLLQNPEVRNTMGKAAAAKAIEQFDLSAMTEAYEKLYS